MEQYDFDDIEIDGSYYTTSDVRLSTTKYVTKEKYDALLQAARALVDAAIDARELMETLPTLHGFIGLAVLEELKQAIAAVERHL